MTELWIDAGDGAAIALMDGKLVARSKSGKRLASVPKRLKESAAAEQLLALRDWLATHERECRETVESFMLRSLPVPRELLLAVFADPAWRAPLRDAVVLGGGEAGFLRAAEPHRGIGVVDLDGESRWLGAELFLVPHPILLDGLDDYRELATELGIVQGVSQLFRETFAKPRDLPPGANAIADFADGKFEQLGFALGRCRTLGVRVRGGFAVAPVWEGGELVEARYWIGADAPEAETRTGELLWVDGRERRLDLARVGPVAFSEGMRMASAIHAARKVEEG
jgi:hypothetical protein